MDKIYLIDAVNYLYRSYFAITSMTNKKGESTNALFGFIRSFYKLIKEFSPNHIVAVFDGPESTKARKALYKEYKGTRGKMPEDLFPQLERAIEWCEIAGIPYLSVPEVEADDTIGSIARWAEKKHAEVFICTSDKDFGQLVSDHIKILNTFKDNLVLDRKGIKETFGVYPEQMTDYLGMMGDASDNIPGLEGFGPKTASSLLTEFGTLDHILSHPEKVSGQKKQDTLIKDKEIALLSRQLATIHIGVDFPKEENFFKLREPDMEKVKAFYHEMYFLSLLKDIEVSPTAQTSAAVEEDIKTEYILVDEEDALQELMTELMKAPEICLDTETTNIKPMEAHLVGIGLGVAPGKAWYVPLNGKLGRQKVLKALKTLFDNPHVSFYAHNMKYDLHVLLNEGLPPPSICFDTIIASYLLNPQQQRHGLDQLALEKFSKVKTPIEVLIGKGKSQLTMDQVPIDNIKAYCCEDVDYCIRLKKIFQKELEDKDLVSVTQDIEIPLIPVLTAMERRGIYIDVKKLHHVSEDLAHQIKILQEHIFEAAGETFNLNSPKQLSVILFEKLKIKPPKKTTTGFSTSADVLESLLGASPIIKYILEYRVLEKLRSTYADSLPQQVFPQTGRIHCTFNQSVAATGRLSCQDPNLQNIPIRSQEGKKIRAAFEPQQPHWSFLSGDYSQIELRLLAHLSDDPVLIKAFSEGEDIHAYTASLVFGIPLKEVTPEMRQQAKAVNFGIVYGQQAFGLSQELGIPYQEAAAFIDKYFQRYKNVKEFFNHCIESARKTGRAITLTGRQRPIPEIHSKNPSLRALGERLAMNTPLQGSQADIIKLAMIQLQDALDKDPELGFMILQIHDELLFEVSDIHVHKLKSLVKSTMENIMQLKVPLSVDISIGKNWGEC